MGIEKGIGVSFGLVGVGALIKGVYDLINGHLGASLFYIGIGSFILSLVIMSYLTYLSIPAEKGNKRRKLLILDRKEIRRSIAISFTILYILLISFYFREVESVTHVISAVNSSVNETVLNVTANSSFTTITILNKTTNLTGNGLTGEGLTHLSSVITAFTTVYLVIIGFYFGSRVYEKIKEIKDAEEALKIQYVMDEIDKDEFKKKMWVLRGVKPQLKVTNNPTQIIIDHEGGDAIYLKDIRMIIKVKEKVKEKKTEFDLVPSGSKKFEITNKIILYMKERRITLEGNEIRDKVPNAEVAEVWEPNNDVEIYVVYKPTKEIIGTMKGKIDP